MSFNKCSPKVGLATKLESAAEGGWRGCFGKVALDLRNPGGSRSIVSTRGRPAVPDLHWDKTCPGQRRERRARTVKSHAGNHRIYMVNTTITDRNACSNMLIFE